MISFELNGKTKIVQRGFFDDGITGRMKDYKLKVYLNGKLLRKKIIFHKYWWKFVKPLKLTKEDTLKCIWEVR